jgi:hypothetical protein
MLRVLDKIDIDKTIQLSDAETMHKPGLGGFCAEILYYSHEIDVG